jgi:hypothetical protein
MRNEERSMASHRRFRADPTVRGRRRRSSSDSYGRVALGLLPLITITDVGHAPQYKLRTDRICTAPLHGLTGNASLAVVVAKEYKYCSAVVMYMRRRC